ncbi:MAG TPA: HAMP domain-containing sensor histidine kinase [Candidatus Dormibacteraeota bacterium]|nr:HAMP domain-containing sensor histidine kinase [Candidatus Dormibacteraeota bacterium]
MNRKVSALAYLIVVGVLVLVLDATAGQFVGWHSDRILDVVFLCLVAALLNIPHVRLEAGRLTLVAIPVGVAALTLNPLDAALVGFASSMFLFRRKAFHIVANCLMSTDVAYGGASVAMALWKMGAVPIAGRLLVLAVCAGLNIMLVVSIFRFRLGVPIRRIIRHNFTASFYLAFGYFALASLLISYVLDGTPLGYLLATIVCVLALALTDTIAGRRVRRVLESELSDADRHVFHTRAVEGVVHNLRNHMATAVGYLKEVDPRRLDPVDRESIETATAAANDAVTVLRTLSQGATPRVSYAVEPVDLGELVTRALGMARPRARTKEVQLAVRESSENLNVKLDPLLMREVITNLVNNAIDAAPVNGRVELSTGKRSNGWPYFSVADNGPGVSDEHRHRLFEPHFTTKEGGTGLGLFMSYGVVREHQGELLYEGNRRGAVFTVVLPPFSG